MNALAGFERPYDEGPEADFQSLQSSPRENIFNDLQLDIPSMKKGE